MKNTRLITLAAILLCAGQPANANPLSVPHIRQVGDTSDNFDGRWACGATSAVMITASYGRLPVDRIWCTFCKPDHWSDYGKYVSEIYTLYGYTFNRSHPTKTGIGYGAYGHIHDYKNSDPGFAWAYRAVNYFRKHGLFAEFDDSPLQSEIKSEIDSGHPVWASTGLWTGGHIVVIKGYTDSQYYVNDPWPNDGSGTNYCDNGENKLYTWTQMGVGSRWVVFTDPISPGDRVKVLYGDVYVREEPRRDAPHDGFVGPAGTHGTILFDTAYGRCFHNADGYTWWKVVWDSGKTGWSACGPQWEVTNWIEKLSATPGDTTPPTVSAFSVTPSSVTPGGSFTISYTVSDTGGSGLKQVELWRSDGDGSESDPKWQQVQTNGHSGNGPVSSSFQDAPPSVGTYWYGLHVLDNASPLSNITTERQAGLGPLQRVVNPAPTKIIGLSGNLTFGSVTVGTTAQRTLTIANSGNSALTVSSISYPAGFSGAWSGSVSASGSKNVTVTFAPTAATSYGGMVTVNSDATSGTNTISASGTGTPPLGNLQVTLGPAGAVSAGAQWNVDGGAWQNSGDTVIGLSVGWHTVNYKAVTGWTAPASEEVNIKSGETTSISHNYTQLIYSISGYVRTSGGGGISGVTMSGWLGTAPVTNSSGYYSGTVSYGWSGTVTPTKAGYIFDPKSRTYTNVTADLTVQNYTGTLEIVGDFCGADFGPPDGYVDVWDLMLFADHWHTDTGDSNWDSKFDLAGPNFMDPDGYVDVWDLMVFAGHWHEGQKP